MAVELPTWQMVRFGLIVTGEGEEGFVCDLFKPLMKALHCKFEVIRRVGQLSPRKDDMAPKLRIVGTAKAVPTRDQDIGLIARTYLNKHPSGFVILVDDLERARASQRIDVFARYRRAFDTILQAEADRTAVFFFVNMLEAYYFAHPAAIKAAIGLDIETRLNDVEAIPHPKNDLKSLAPGFDEIRDGKKIVQKLDLAVVLGKADTCASLRALVAWVFRAVGQPFEGFGLEDGIHDIVTGRQAARLPHHG